MSFMMELSTGDNCFHSRIHLSCIQMKECQKENHHSEFVPSLKQIAETCVGGSHHLELNPRHLLVRLQVRAEQDKGESRKNSTAHHDD